MTHPVPRRGSEANGKRRRHATVHAGTCRRGLQVRPEKRLIPPKARGRHTTRGFDQRIVRIREVSNMPVVTRHGDAPCSYIDDVRQGGNKWPTIAKRKPCRSEKWTETFGQDAPP